MVGTGQVARGLYTANRLPKYQNTETPKPETLTAPCRLPNAILTAKFKKIAHFSERLTA
jgi:hypothetical protein